MRTLGRLKWLAIGALAGGAIAAGATALASGSGSPEAITACVAWGRPRIVADASQCKAYETPTIWNVAGPTGTTGPTGAVGSLDDLGGKPCTVNGGTGTVVVETGVNFNVSIFCVAADVLEPNDTEATATDETAQYAASGSANVIASIDPPGESDWYLVNGKIIASIQVNAPGGPLQVDLYSDGILVGTASAPAGSPAGIKISTGSPDPHVYTARITGPRRLVYSAYFSKY